MLKTVLSLMLGVVLVFGLTSAVSARSIVVTKKVVSAATPAPTPTPAPEKVNSFDMFWPMVAGKTSDSKLYFLKILKEQVREFFIFGKAQKADYEIFRSVKRILEAEASLISGKKDVANNALDNASKELDQAKSNFDASKAGDGIPQNIKDEVNQKLSNLKKLISYLISQYPDNKDKLQEVLNKLNAISI